jgi:hypothetical protein
MNVSEVIEALQKLPPHLPVRAVMSTVFYGDEFGEIEINPDSSEAQEVTAIQWRGHDVLFDCDGMTA